MLGWACLALCLFFTVLGPVFVGGERRRCFGFASSRLGRGGLHEDGRLDRHASSSGSARRAQEDGAPGYFEPVAIAEEAEQKGRRWRTRWAETLQRWVAIQENDILPDEETLEEVATACAEAGRWQEALQVLRAVSAEEVLPRNSIYNAVLEACVPGGHWRRALLVLDDMLWSELEPDAISYENALQCIYNNPRAWQSSFGDLREVFQQKVRAVAPASSQAVCRTMMRNYLRPGLWQEVLRALGELKARGEAPEAPTVVVAMGAGRWRWQVAHELYESLRLPGFSNVEANRALAKAYSRGGAPDRALELLQETRNSGLSPDAVVYDAAIECCEKQGVKHWMLQLLSESVKALLSDSEARQAEGKAPEVAAFRAAIASSGKCGQWQTAIHIMEEFARFRGDADSSAYNLLARACAQAGQTDKVISVLEEMREWRLQPDATAYLAGVYELLIRNQAEDARLLYKESCLSGASARWMVSMTCISVGDLPPEAVPFAVRYLVQKQLQSRDIFFMTGAGDGTPPDEQAASGLADIVHEVCLQEYGLHLSEAGPGVFTVLASELKKITRKVQAKAKKKKIKPRRLWPEDFAFGG